MLTSLDHLIQQQNDYLIREQNLEKKIIILRTWRKVTIVTPSKDIIETIGILSDSLICIDPNCNRYLKKRIHYCSTSCRKDHLKILSKLQLLKARTSRTIVR